MTRASKIVAILALFILGAWVYSGRVSPQVRAARAHAQQFAQYLLTDARFTNVQVRVWEIGTKGPVYVQGHVRTDSDAAELRRAFDAMGCPVGVSWNVAVDADMSGGVR